MIWVRLLTNHKFSQQSQLQRITSSTACLGTNTDSQFGSTKIDKLVGINVVSEEPARLPGTVAAPVTIGT
jgi:hypothetical protein